MKPEGGSLAGGAIQGADRDPALTSVAGIALAASFALLAIVPLQAFAEPDAGGVGIDHPGHGPFLMRHGGNIRESQQFGDPVGGRFFMRVDFEVADAVDADVLRADFAATAEEIGAMPRLGRGATRV